MRRSIDIGGKADPALKRAKVIDRRDDLLPTGSTLLNLALSDNPYGGYAKGTFANFIGNRSSGKTFLSWSLLAEMNAAPVFNNYNLYYDDAEHRLRIAVEKMYGKGILDRVKLEESEVIEDYYEDVIDKFETEKPFVDVLDTFDSLQDREAAKRKELKKDYPAKTALFTEMFRKISGRIRRTNSFLIVVSQVRANMGIIIGPKFRRAGGEALGHYCTYEMWLSQRGAIIRKGKEVGHHILLKVTKNSATGKEREVSFDILDDYGIDNIGSMVDWMAAEGFWIKEKKKKEKEEKEKEKRSQKIDTGSDYGSLTRDKLVKKIDSEEREQELIGIVAECWQKVEKEIATDRRPRYK